MANEINITDLSTKAAAALTTGDSIITFSSDGDTNQTPFYEAVDAANDANGCVCVKVAELTLTTAQILAGFTTPVQFGLTVAAGVYIKPLSIDLFSDYAGVAYATNINLRVRAVGSSTYISSYDISFAADQFAPLSISGTAGIQFITAVDLEAYIATGNPTAGTSDITLYMTYLEIDTN